MLSSPPPELAEERGRAQSHQPFPAGPGGCAVLSVPTPGRFAHKGEGSTWCCLKDESPGAAAAGCAALTASLLLIHFARFLSASFLLGSDQAGTAVNRAAASC